MLHTIYNTFMTFIGGVKVNADIAVLAQAMEQGYQGLFTCMSIMVIVSLFWLLAWKLPIMIVGAFTKTTETTLLTWSTHIDKALLIIAAVFICAPILPAVALTIGG